MNQLDEYRDLTSRRKKAIDRCAQQIEWYEAHGSRESFFYRFFQTCAIVFGGLTPILILWSDVPKPLQALPAALAAIAAGLVGVFQWQQNWVRFASTAEALKSELIRFETRTSPAYRPEVTDDVAIDNFVQAVEALVLSETSGWHTQLLKQPANTIPNKD